MSSRKKCSMYFNKIIPWVMEIPSSTITLVMERASHRAQNIWSSWKMQITFLALKKYLEKNLLITVEHLMVRLHDF